MHVSVQGKLNEAMSGLDERQQYSEDLAKKLVTAESSVKELRPQLQQQVSWQCSCCL